MISVHCKISYVHVFVYLQKVKPKEVFMPVLHFIFLKSIFQLVLALKTIAHFQSSHLQFCSKIFLETLMTLKQTQFSNEYLNNFDYFNIFFEENRRQGLLMAMILFDLRILMISILQKYYHYFWSHGDFLMQQLLIDNYAFELEC